MVKPRTYPPTVERLSTSVRQAGMEASARGPKRMEGQPAVVGTAEDIDVF